MINPEVIGQFLDQNAPSQSIDNMANAVKELEDYLSMAHHRQCGIYHPYVVGLDGVYLVPLLNDDGNLTGKSETYLNPLYATRYNEMQSEDIASVSYNAAHINFKPIPLHDAVEDALVYYRLALRKMKTMVH